jgi:hypothetical protein
MNRAGACVLTSYSDAGSVLSSLDEEAGGMTSPFFNLYTEI